MKKTGESSAIASGARLGPYEIVALLGAGGMGQVYRARDPRLGRSVAIKVLPPSSATDPKCLHRFEAEARAAGALDHPNVLVVYDIGRDGDTPYIVSEILDGETLRRRLTEGALPLGKALDLAVQIAQGLGAAHERKIVHRDLKPENLFLTRDGRVKILDFGLAKLFGPRAEDEATATREAATSAGVVLGTVGYMSPEQVRGEPADHRADIFALGVVIHEMLSGRRPFHRSSSADTLSAILKEDPPELPPAVPPAVDRIVRRCLEKRPEDRFHSAHDLGLALDAARAPAPRPSEPGVAARAPVPSRRRTLAVAATMLAVGLAGGALLESRLAPSRSPTFQRVTFRRGLVRSARFAPDGHTILYAASWGGDDCRVHVVRPESPESRPLELPPANLLAISPSGEVALALGSHLEGVITYGTLARVPLAGGVPREILEDVKFADWSPDGTELAVVHRVAGRDRLEFPVGRVLVESGGSGASGLAHLRVSPKGDRVAFIEYTSARGLSGRVSVVDRAGAKTPLTPDYFNIFGLSWRDDELWFTAADERPLSRAVHAVAAGRPPRLVARIPGNSTLWDVSRDGHLLMAHTDDRTGIMALAAGDSNERDLSWLDASRAADLSRDGRLLLFWEAGQGGGTMSSTYLRRTDGSPPVRLGEGQAAALSPDGKWALCSSVTWPSRYLDLLPTGPGETRRIEGNGLRFWTARWLPDGKRIVALAEEEGHGRRVYVLSLGGGQPRALTADGITSWALSPEGTTIATRGPDPAIRLQGVNGGEARTVPGLAGSEVLVAWIDAGLLVAHPDGTSYWSGRMYRVDPTTGRQESWKEIVPADRAGLMALLTFQVTPDGRSYAYSWHRALSDLYLVEGLR